MSFCRILLGGQERVEVGFSGGGDEEYSIMAEQASVTGALVEARLGYRTLNKDPDPMASFSLAYLFILFPFQGICSLRDTEQDDNKWPLVMTSWKCRSYKNVDLGFKTPGEATEGL
ncbi:hypothetical protein C5167_042543 [Papaver somniferum]|uniref:Uncharacterized protein n=1 Tax=Papaver somniferum TaxID=3469 RepID=A0A4Y7L718_PAPSO|nr:hypothetical protein C5167_042543 [Papaver somniferum]